MRQAVKHGKIPSAVLWLIIVSLLFFIGYILKNKAARSPSVEKDTSAAAEVWTCSMHPQIRQPKPGLCPLCGMDLVPVGGQAAHAAGTLELTPEAVKLMDIQTSVVRRQRVVVSSKLIGKLDYDQSRLKTITAWTGGRIERLFVDYAGMAVSKDDHLAELYSPELVSAQTELLQAVQSAASVGPSVSDLVGGSIRGATVAARDKLRLLGITPEQIRQLETSGKVMDRLVIYAPIGGVVVEKMITEGMYVERGMPLYQIADLSKLWLMLDAYESDLFSLRYGQHVRFSVESYPGIEFEAMVSFISPSVDSASRTVKVRAVVDNQKGLLKPQMFVRAMVDAAVDSAGKAAAVELAGKWICPMHGEVIKEASGSCDICGMALVEAQKQGSISDANDLPLTIPATAALITGRNLNKAIVYVKVQGGRPVFVGREVVLGPRAGDVYIVRQGLMEGEAVVVHGAFKLDSSAQIQAIPSMMTRKVSDDAAGGEQTHCPVMGGPIDKAIFTEYQGHKVYFCCQGCVAEFNKEPQKWVKDLPQFKP